MHGYKALVGSFKQDAKPPAAAVAPAVDCVRCCATMRTVVLDAVSAALNSTPSAFLYCLILFMRPGTVSSAASSLCVQS